MSDLESDEPNILECPWFLRLHDERVIDPATTSPRTRRWVLVPTSSDNVGGLSVHCAGPFWVESKELENEMRFCEHIIGLQNAKAMPKPRNVNQVRDTTTGKFTRKSP
jgi:predicted nucleic acid-binding Zn finger protein